MKRMFKTSLMASVLLAIGGLVRPVMAAGRLRNNTMDFTVSEGASGHHSRKLASKTKNKTRSKSRRHRHSKRKSHRRKHHAVS